MNAIAATADMNVLDWATAAAAFLALILSIVALLTSRLSEKKADFFRIHDRLMSTDAQEGRRLLYSTANKDRFFDWGPIQSTREDEFDRINYAVGLFEMLAQYRKYHYIPSRRVRQIWFDTIREHWPTIESLIRWRRSRSRNPVWHELEWLGRKAGADVQLEPTRAH